MDGMIILRLTLRWGGMDWIGLAHDRDRWLALGKCSNEPSGSIKCREFLD
jgi:hypothetical protein